MQRRNLTILLALLALGGSLLLLLVGPRLQRANESVLQSADFDRTTPEIARIPDGLGAIQPGEQAPDFALLDVNGTPVSLDDYADRPLLLNFWATWCAPCTIEMPALQAAYDAHADSGFVVLALNQDESPETIERYYAEHGLSFPALQDTNMVTAAQYGVYSMYPTSIFIDRSGMVSAVHRGIMTEGQIDGYLAEILPSP